MGKYLLGCDWGTSTFRLRLITTADGQPMGEVVSSEGVRRTFDAWKETTAQTGIARIDFFRQRLRHQIDLLAQAVALDLTAIPVVISGMASSSIGMDEIDYASLPVPVDGSQINIRLFPGQAGFPHDSILISGVRTQHDVMRGEETQLVGLLTVLAPLLATRNEFIVIIPGTHSKHIRIKNQQIVDLKTFMTGELFDVLTNHSILKDSVEKTAGTTFTPDEAESFIAGVREASSASLLNHLFRVRTNQLFGQLTKKQNAFYLSGLLIGTELTTLKDDPEFPFVVASPTFFNLYRVAINEIGLANRMILVPADLLDLATSIGQLKISKIN